MEKKYIYLVDDDPTNLTVGSTALEKHYNVVTLNTGARLLKMLEKRIPDLILLDIEMPEMDGFQTIVRIKSNEKFKNILVIFLTAKNDCQSELEGLSLGAIDFITKPFSPPLLLKRVYIHLLVESQQQELVRFNNHLQDMVDQKTRTVLELQNTVLKTMAELVEFRDTITGSHIERTQSYLRILIDGLRKSGYCAEEVAAWDSELLLQSAQLHDIGKIAIEDNILRKPTKLTPGEFEKIKVHTVFGEKVIQKIKKNTSNQVFLEQARLLAFTHHEKWDGTGYPSGLKGMNIPLQGRLMAVADVYDALVSNRPYKTALEHEQAVEIIKKQSGTHFDPALVDLFLNVSDEFKINNNIAMQKNFDNPE